MGAGLLLGASVAADADQPVARVALSASVSGAGAIAGQAMVNAVRLAAEDAQAKGGGPRIDIITYDDRSTEDGAREAARQATEGGALAVIGPSLTIGSLAAGPVYAQAGLASVVSTAHGDKITDNATTFRTVFSTSEMGDALASYFNLVLGVKRAVVIYKDNGYGVPFADGVRRVAKSQGLQVDYLSFSTPAERDERVRQAAAVPGAPAIFLGMTVEDAVPVLINLRRIGGQGSSRLGPIAATATLARANIPELFAGLPEEAETPGHFLEGVFAVSPMILDSTNSAVLAFAERYRVRYGQEPSWEAVQCYDAFTLVATALSTVFAAQPPAGLAERRAAVRAALARFDSPRTASSGLTEPIWFTSDRGRGQSVRIGRFHHGLFESVAVQLLPEHVVDRGEIKTGAVVDIGSGRFVRWQSVVFTGIYLNEISRVDVAQSTFTADFYLWIRYAGGTDLGIADPAEIDFPDMQRGNFDAKHPALSQELDDGSIYKLWHVRGDFKNDFDLHRYPLDRQLLVLRLFNSRAASDKVVYARDRGMIDGEAPRGMVPLVHGGVADKAFRNLTQWEARRSEQLRDMLTTESALGDRRLIGMARVHELSGYRLEVELARRTLPTLVKTLLPVAIMGLILFASLWFPQGLIKEKITVAVTAALSGSVLLSSVNAQLGMVGYTMAVEYFFFIFFILCLLCIVAVLVVERLRITGCIGTMALVERGTKVLYATTIVGTFIAGLVFAWVG